MSTRELAKSLIDQVPENKLLYIIAYLQGAAIPELGRKILTDLTAQNHHMGLVPLGICLFLRVRQHIQPLFRRGCYKMPILPHKQYSTFRPC